MKDHGMIQVYGPPMGCGHGFVGGCLASDQAKGLERLRKDCSRKLQVLPRS